MPDEPFRAFPSWFMRITCDRCGKDRMLNEAHTPQRDLLIRDLIAKTRHDGCGGRAGRVELLTGIESASTGRCGRSCCSTDEAPSAHGDDEGRGVSLVTTHDNRTPAIIEAELLEARRELQRWQQAFGRYTGNNPNEFTTDIRRARAVVRRLEAELRRAKAG